MAWSKGQQEKARTQGWGIFDVYTQGKMRYMPLPLKFTSKCPSSAVLTSLLVEQARQRDALAIAAIHHITANGS